MELHLIADTNLFFECKALEQLPWLELGYDPVVVLLTKPVLDEIDKHKKGTGRTRARALDIFGRVRAMLAASEAEAEIQSSSPRVVLRRMPVVAPDPALEVHLDYTKTDERLVGIVSTLKARASGYEVMLFTDDTGPASTADNLGVPYLMINETWRRPPAETTEGKRIRELEKDIATYRAQEPRISIGACEPADKSRVVKVTRKVAKPLTEDEVEGFLAALLLKLPIVADFTPPETSVSTDCFGVVTTTRYAYPPEAEIAKYRDVSYPSWIGQCRKILKALHEGRDELEPPVLLRWPMSNGGTRPASQVRIEFEAVGDLELRRVPNDEEEADEANALPPAATHALVDRLPPAPEPPAFPKEVTRSTPIAPSTQGLSLSSRAASIFAKDVARIAELQRPQGFLGIDQLSQLMGSSSMREAIAMAQRHSEIFRASGLDAIMRTPPDAQISHWSIEPVKIPQLHIPQRREPEKFYFDDWSATEPVKKGALTCELWRHQASEEVFEFEVLFTKEGDARGAVQCTVHAENLTMPEQERVAVVRNVETLSLAKLANSMVEACR